MIGLDNKIKEISLEKKLEKYWFDNGFINENCKFKKLSEVKPDEDKKYLFINYFQGRFINEFIGTLSDVRNFRQYSDFTHFLELPISTIK